MKYLLGTIFGITLLASGCATTGGSGKSSSEVAVGKPIATIILAHRGQRMDYFDKGSKQVRTIARGESGSVSIFNKDETAQDNYAFDNNGTVLKHRYSYGDDFKPGKWRDGK